MEKVFPVEISEKKPARTPSRISGGIAAEVTKEYKKKTSGGMLQTKKKIVTYLKELLFISPEKILEQFPENSLKEHQ